MSLLLTHRSLLSSPSPSLNQPLSLSIATGLSGIRVEPINEERAIRCLQRIELLSVARLEVSLSASRLGTQYTLLTFFHMVTVG